MCINHIEASCLLLQDTVELSNRLCLFGSLNQTSLEPLLS
nr:MAG TPA_asm: hypothetical protein [Bacteriophage sp.]